MATTLSSNVDQRLSKEEFDKFDVAAMYDKLGLAYEDYIMEDEGRYRAVQFVVTNLDGNGNEIKSEKENSGSLNFSKKCIDLGCASGRPVVELLATKRNYDVIGVDISSEQLRLGRERIPNATFVQSDICEFEPHPKVIGNIQAVLSFYAFNHLPVEDFSVMFKRIHTWLADDGVFVLGSVLGVNGRVSWMGYEVSATAVQQDELVEMISSAGFEVDSSWTEEWKSTARPDARPKINQFVLARKKRKVV